MVCMKLEGKGVRLDRQQNGAQKKRKKEQNHGNFPNQAAERGGAKGEG